MRCGPASMVLLLLVFVAPVPPVARAGETSNDEGEVAGILGPRRAPDGITLAPALAALQIGARVDGLRLLPPFEVVKGTMIRHPDYDETDGLYPIQLALADDGKTIRGFHLSFFGTEKEELIARRWGPGRPTFTKYGPNGRIWFDARRGLRATSLRIVLMRDGEGIRRTVVHVVPCMPLDEWIGAPGRPFGFETIPLLGAKVAEVVKAFGLPPFGDEVSMMVVPLACTEIGGDDGTLRANLYVKNDRVWATEVSIDAQWDRRQLAVLLSRLRAKLGRGHKAPHPWRDRRKSPSVSEAFEGPLRAHLSVRDAQLELVTFAPGEDVGSTTPP